MAAEDHEHGPAEPDEGQPSSEGRHRGRTIAARSAEAIEAAKRHPWWILIAFAGGVLTLTGTILSIITGLPAAPQSMESIWNYATSHSAPISTPQAAVTSPAPSATPTPTKTLPPLETLNLAGAGRACPLPNPSDFKLPDVEICVTMWCQSLTFNLDGTPEVGQTQIKLKASVFNKTTQPLDISITKTSAMRLLVAESNLPGSWKPPRKTAAAGDRPVLVEWAGSGSKQNYWAVPPNVYADSYPTPAGVYTGFYTQWNPPLLESGQGYYRPRPEVLDPSNEDGNLVFQLPVGSQVAGLAVVDKADPSKIIGVTPFSDWKDREVPPDSF